MRYYHRLFRAERRSEAIERLRSDFRAVAKDAKIESERLGPAPGHSPFMTIPPEYRKILDAFGMCTPKTRRLANLTLEIFDRMDSRHFMHLLKESFFDQTGNLKPGEFHDLFLGFHSALLDEIRKMRAEGTYAIPLYKAEIILRKKHSGS
ncbi:MAG: hypothetical protein AB1324_05585 [Candidatus Micrarchaeota archaeon]